MSRFSPVSEPSIISLTVPATSVARDVHPVERWPCSAPGRRQRTAFTGLIGTICMFPLRAIIGTCVRLRIHPNVLTFVGVVINVLAAWALALGRFVLAGVIMIVANIFDFIDGKVAHE